MTERDRRPGDPSRRRGVLSATRRLVARAISELQHSLLKRHWAGRSGKCVSAMVRVKDEEEFLYPAVQSIAQSVDEIVIVDNLSTDGTPAVIEALRREYPERVVAYRYPYAMKRRGSEYQAFMRRSGWRRSPHITANYYNWCLRQCTKPFVLKWDGDMIATEVFHEAVERWRGSGKLLMIFKGANIHPDRQHLVSPRWPDAGELAAASGVPALPAWVATPMTYTAAEPRLFPKRFATYRPGLWGGNRLHTPARDLRRDRPTSWRVEDVCYLHLKFCKREPFSDFSPEFERAVASNIAVGPSLGAEWLELLGACKISR